MAKSTADKIEELKSEIMEQVRLLSDGKIQTVYQIMERGKELLKLERETGAEPESEPNENRYPPEKGQPQVKKKRRGAVEKEDF